jgi:hypothetical protein
LLTDCGISRLRVVKPAMLKRNIKKRSLKFAHFADFCVHVNPPCSNFAALSGIVRRAVSPAIATVACCLQMRRPFRHFSRLRCLGAGASTGIAAHP